MYALNFVSLCLLTFVLKTCQVRRQTFLHCYEFSLSYSELCLGNWLTYIHHQTQSSDHQNINITLCGKTLGSGKPEHLNFKEYGPILFLENSSHLERYKIFLRNITKAMSWLPVNFLATLSWKETSISSISPLWCIQSMRNPLQCPPCKIELHFDLFLSKTRLVPNSRMHINY